VISAAVLEIFTPYRMIPLGDIQQMANAAYSPNPPEQIGKFTLFEQTATLKFYYSGKYIVVCIRGTKPSDQRDLAADALAGIGRLRDSARWKADLATVEEVQRDFPRSHFYYIGVGHSLGGALLDLFLRGGYIRSGISYNAFPEPHELKGNPYHRRIYSDEDPIYKYLARVIPGIEVRKSNDPIWKRLLKFSPPYAIWNALQKHTLDTFRGGAAAFETSKKYLGLVKKKAKAEGYNPKDIAFSDDDEHKFQIRDPEGRIVRFGRKGYGDFIIWTHLEKAGEATVGTAEMKRDVFWKSHTKIKGDWKKNDYSPNWLSLRILW